jgi:hypothetical protein
MLSWFPDSLFLVCMKQSDPMNIFLVELQMLTANCSSRLTPLYNH